MDKEIFSDRNLPVRVFIDTNGFINESFDVSPESALSFLKYHVEMGAIRLLTSRIVISESHKHIEEDLRQAYNIIKKIPDQKTTSKRKIKQCFTILKSDEKYASFLPDLPKVDDLVHHAIFRFDEYIKALDFEIMDCSGFDLDAIITDYFKNNPPFELGKKHEFPDAFIIAKILSICEADKPFIVISTDSGFKSALKDKDGIVLFDSVKALLNEISINDLISDRFRLCLGGDFDTTELIADAVREKIEQMVLTVDGIDIDRHGVVSGFEYDDTELDKVEIEKLQLATIDSISDEYIYTTFSCTALLEFTCSFLDHESSIWDKEEKKYLYEKDVVVKEKHRSIFTVEIVFYIAGVNLEEDGGFELESVSEFDIPLDEATRLSQQIINDYGTYGNCPDCGCALDDWNYGGNGFCTNCTPNY